MSRMLSAIEKRLIQAIREVNADKVEELFRMHPETAACPCPDHASGWMGFALQCAAQSGAAFKQLKPVLQCLRKMHAVAGTEKGPIWHACDFHQPEALVWLVRDGYSLMQTNARREWVRKSLSEPEWMDPADLLPVLHRRHACLQRAQVAWLMLLRGSSMEAFEVFAPQEWEGADLAEKMPEALAYILSVREGVLRRGEDHCRVDKAAWDGVMARFPGSMQGLPGEHVKPLLSLVEHANLALATPPAPRHAASKARL